MELRTHAHILRNARWFIILMTIVVGVAAMIFTIVRPVPYKAVASFEVNFINRPAAEALQYGAYYDLKAAEIYTQHLMSLFLTPAVVAEVYETAGMGYEIDSIAQFTHRFQTKQYSAQHFAVIFKDYNKGTAENLAKAIGTVVEKHTKTSGSINDQEVFSVTAFTPVVAEAELEIWLVTIVGALAGCIVSVLLVYLREYFSS